MMIDCNGPVQAEPEDRAPVRCGSGVGCSIRDRARSALPTLTAVAVALASSVLLVLGGCADSAGIKPVAQPIAPATLGLAGPDDQPTTGPKFAADWWTGFGDKTLDGLVDDALTGSPNLKTAQARIELARSTVAGAQSADGFHLSGQGSISRQHLSGNGFYPLPLGGSTFTVVTGELDASYEFDFFGRNRAAIEAAIGFQRAADADLQAARLELSSSVARAYVQLGRLFAQRGVAERSLAQRDETLALIQQRVSSGLDTNVDLREGQGALPESRQQIESLDEQIALGRHALAALTAQAPTAYDNLVVPLEAVNAVPVPEAVPADLLGRRADISAARWRVEAATSNVKSAKAAFYPNINLSAAAGLSALGFDKFLRGTSRQYSATPALTLPIFDGGRLRSDLSGRTADLDAAIESYNGTVISAVRDAADQISSARSVARQQAQQQLSRVAAESAYDLALQRYGAGLGTYLTVLTAETNVLTQRRLSADLKARALEVQIGIVRALGGSYNDDTRLGETAEDPPLSVARR